MIKKIFKFLNKYELKLSQQYWYIKEGTIPATDNIRSLTPGARGIYGECFSEALLLNKKKLIEKTIGEILLPTYSYARFYYYKGELKEHRDRSACEISITLNIFADKDWPLWFAPLKNKKQKPKRIITKPGDAAVYEGCLYKHWRKPYSGKKCMQIFLHYVRANGDYTNYAKDEREYYGQRYEDRHKRVWNSL